MTNSAHIMTRLSKIQRTRQSSFGFLLQLLSRRMDGVMKAHLHEIDVDIKIFANLMMLADKDGISQRELGRLLEFPEYYTSRNVDALVDAGYVERKPDPESRRSVRVFLTKRGREKAAELPKVIQAVNMEFLTKLDSADRETLIELMQKVAEIPADGDPAL